jgi:hypothetical protein
MWSTHTVSAVYASLIAVFGTLLGSVSTYLFQQRTGAFAAAVTELKRGVVAAWLRRSDPDGHRLALAEADRLGAFAEAARFRLLLMSGRPEPLADAAFAHMDTLGSAAGLAELKAAEADFEAAVSAFILDVSERLAVPRRSLLH